MAIATELSRVCYPLVGKGCRSASFRVGQNAGTTEQSAPALRDKGGKKRSKIGFLMGKPTDNRKQGHGPLDSE